MQGHFSTGDSSQHRTVQDSPMRLTPGGRPGPQRAEREGPSWGPCVTAYWGFWMYQWYTLSSEDADAAGQF